MAVRARRKPAGRSSRAARRPAGRARPRATGAGRGKAKRASRPGTVRRAGAGVARHLSPRVAEALGIGLMLLALLSVLGLWFEAGGPFGELLRIAVRGLFGPAGYALPVVACYWGLLMLRGSTREERGRRLVGLILAALGALGVLSMAGGNPSPAAGYQAV